MPNYKINHEDREVIKWFLEFLEGHAVQIGDNPDYSYIEISIFKGNTEFLGLCSIIDTLGDEGYFEEFPHLEDTLETIIERFGPRRNSNKFQWETGMLEPRLDWLRSMI